MFHGLGEYYHGSVVSAFVEYRDIKANGTAGRISIPIGPKPKSE